MSRRRHEGWALQRASVVPQGELLTLNAEMTGFGTLVRPAAD